MSQQVFHEFLHKIIQLYHATFSHLNLLNFLLSLLLFTIKMNFDLEIFGF